MTIRIEEDGGRDTGICPCCGSTSRVVWGYAYHDDACLAAYYVHWTLGQVRQHGANFDLIVGPWGEGAKAEDRRSIALEYRIVESRPSFMLIDAAGRLFTSSPIAGAPLARADIIGTPLAGHVFALIDAIMIEDRRLKDLTQAGHHQ